MVLMLSIDDINVIKKLCYTVLASAENTWRQFAIQCSLFDDVMMTHFIDESAREEVWLGLSLLVYH